MSRTVRVKDTDRAGLSSFEVSATTFGELKDQLSETISFFGKRAIIRETRVTLEASDAQLPEGDFTLYLMPEKSKAGGDFTSLSFHQLRSLCSSVGLPANGVSRSQMEQSLNNYYRDEQPSASNVDASQVAEAIVLIQQALAILNTVSEGVDSSVLAEINAEYEELRAELGL